MKQRYLLTVACIFFTLFAFAQETITISGNIQDEKKQAMPGATVVVKGTGIGTVADAAGNYTLKVPKDAKTLIISYVGHQPKEIAIDPNQGNYVLNVDMKSTPNEMDQLIVSASKKNEKILDAPASVSVLGQEKLERNIVTTPVDQLKTTPGVDVMRTGLISSNVVVRGFNNIFSGSVLNVIDNRIASVPSLRVNAYQLVPVSNMDFERIEVVRGPASALYGPNASSGVVHIMTRSPLEQKKKFETTVAMTSGFTVLDKSYKGYNNGSVISGNIINPELRHSGKLANGKFGYKVSGSYFQGQDYPNYDPREPYDGDSILFGNERNGVAFKPDTLGYEYVTDTNGVTDTLVKLDIRRFKKDFAIRKYTADARFDIKPIEDITITINGGLAGTRNVELTGLGAATAGGPTGAWIYWYFQTRFKWKNLYLQYFINSSNAGNTFLIPQLSESARTAYQTDVKVPPKPYQIRRLVDRSKIHVLQIQHSWNPLEKLGFVYGFDALLTRPDTKGTINGRFEDKDNLNQFGGYLQGDYEPLKWLRIVAAARVDYNSIIKNVAVSPRAAIVFKPAMGHNIRVTYNRAFDSPTTLNQFLDLSNGVIPNGINVRGIGNPYGWKYNFDESSKVVQFKVAPWGGNVDSAKWVTFGDNSYNVQGFDSLLGFVAKTFYGSLVSSGTSPDIAQVVARSIVNNIFNGIGGPGGTVETAKQVSVDYADFATNKNLPASYQDVKNFEDMKKINNSFTQTLELGYKGFFFNKLSIQVDGYWTRVSNYVSALRAASGAVMLDHASYLDERLRQNLEANGGGLNNTLMPLLNGNPSLQNESIIDPDPNSVFDELIVMTYQFPMGTITPNDADLVGSDFILTYKNVGRLDVFGIDFGLQYNIYDDSAHSVSAGGSFSWVDKDQFVLTSGDSIALNAPKTKMSVTFDHQLKKPGIGYGLTFRYQQGYHANSSIYEGDVKAAYLLDARLSWRAPFYKGLLLSINVNNIANYQWRSFPGTPLTGTQFFARAQVTF